MITMNIKIDNPSKADTFSAVFQNMKSFTDNVNIIFDDEKMFVQAIDAGHVSILELNIPIGRIRTFGDRHGEGWAFGLGMPTIQWEEIKDNDDQKLKLMNYSAETVAFFRLNLREMVW